MIRRHATPGRCSIRPLLIGLIGAAWLAGCSSQAVQTESGTNPAEAYTQLGMAYLERDNLPRAQGALNRALEAAPNDAETLQALAMVYQRQGESELADEHFQRALSANAGFTRARNNYAAFLYDQGRLTEACTQLEQATQDTQYDNRAQLFANLGQCQREMGNLGAAVTSLERAQAIDSRNPRSYFTLAEIEYAQGNHSQAWEQLQSFMRLAGSTPDSLELARDIADARGDTENRRFFTEQLNALGNAP
ncbi:type IV pilus biogenesis/stability protein PilW [Halomonas sp. ML-15]|uniref:type IV pilus biogenesis/stability protein PilW n=1 Tax=Halomonas sp. ML-15 TaxID=2773305 RepID=UPI001747830A|nr:type IV pilus biogenesis/stability protein PilW [Halomonas sp. ML-15]MBD3896621.1 type IV pilus biogenesis/stability protein PilW [Halomonas sp. ML-15]